MSEVSESRGFVIRPSSLATMLLCPARGYKEFLSQHQPTAHPSAAAVGTCVHKAAETYWKLCIKAQEKLEYDTQLMTHIAQKEFESIEADPGLNWASDHTMTIAMEQIAIGVDAYGKSIVPTTDIPLAVEMRVEKKIDHPVVSAISGTIDAVYPDHIVDIKCRMKNRKKNTSEFTIQQSIYVMLARHAGYEIKESKIHQILLGNGVVHNEDCFINIPKVEFIISNLLERLEAVHNGLSPDVAFSGNSDHFLCNKRWCDYWEGCHFARGNNAVIPISSLGNV